MNMRWTMWIVATLMLFSAGCAANRAVSGDGNPATAPSRLAAENDAAIKAGVDASMREASERNERNDGWSVPPGQNAPDRPDGEDTGRAGFQASNGRPGGNPLGGIFPASGKVGDIIPDAMKVGSLNDSRGQGSGAKDYRPLGGVSNGRVSNGSVSNGRVSNGRVSNRRGPGAGGSMAVVPDGTTGQGAYRGGIGAASQSGRAIPGGVVVAPLAGDRPGSTARRRTPIVKPLVPAFPARMRQERLNALHPVRFGFDRWRVGGESLAVLRTNAAWMKANPDVAVRIEGHADERGTPEYNMALGERRARNVRETLIRLGVDPARLVTVSYGEEMPVEAGSAESAWTLNRRTEFSRVERRAVSVNLTRPGRGS